MKQLEVQIMGQNYMLGCPENSKAQLLEAVDSVNSAMCKIRDAGKVKARDRIAVLAALNLAYQLLEPAPVQADPPVPDQPVNALDSTSEASQARLQALLYKLDAALGSQVSQA